MALLDLALLGDSIAYVDTTTSPSGQDLISANAIDAATTIYYGDGAINTGSIVGIEALANTNIIATQGADVTLDAGLLNLELVESRNLIIDGDSSITLQSADIGVLGVVTELLNSTKVAFTGALPGTFTFVPPSVALLNSFTITVDEMQAGDRIVIPIAGTSTTNSLRESQFLGAYTGYDAASGYLTLTNGSILTNAITVRIKMTQAEYNAFSANRANLLLGAQDTFIFPGTPAPGQPDYEAPCFVRGTLIATPTGPVAVEDLRVGDLILTKDNGPQPLRWIGHAKINPMGFAKNMNLRPIRIRAGALGPDRPAQDLMVSPQHRMLVSSKIAARLLEAPEVLVAAKQLLAIEGIEVVHDVDYVEYFHLLLDRHEIIYANGAETESLYTGPQAIKALGPEAAEEIFTLFPALRQEGTRPLPARPIAPGRTARDLADRHARKARPLTGEHV